VYLHPQLCVGDGEEFLKVLLAGNQTDRLYIAACDPRMQETSVWPPARRTHETRKCL
jgi:heterodisulfide reductase subunit A-like polyferredoxin